ncbi:hypothetical protein ACHAXR_003705 [Thalassiosira sp. AJA248-18]
MVDKCNCGYEQYHGVEVAVENNPNPPLTAAATQQAHPPPPAQLPFNIPTKPDPVTGKGSKRYIKDIINIQKRDGTLDLLLFGPTWGKRPHCGGSDICDTNVNVHVKTIRTLNQPRFVQGLGMKCNNVNCNGKGWQTFESSYVSTLPSRHQSAFNAQVVGASDGICMDLVIQMRVGVTASALEKTSRANLMRWHNNQLKDDYEHRVKTARDQGHTVLELAFPPANDLWVAKSSSITNAFLRDSANHRDPPTSDTVRDIMPTKTTKLGNKSKEIDVNLLLRQERAKQIMELQQQPSASAYDFLFGDVPHI